MLDSHLTRTTPLGSISDDLDIRSLDVKGVTVLAMHFDAKTRIPFHSLGLPIILLGSYLPGKPRNVLFKDHFASLEPQGNLHPL